MSQRVDPEKHTQWEFDMYAPRRGRKAVTARVSQSTIDEEMALFEQAQRNL